MAGPHRPNLPGMGPIPNDEYGQGQMQVDPRFSRNTNRRAVFDNTTDGNVGDYEQMYGTLGMEPDPYGGADHGLSPGDIGADKLANMRHQKLLEQGSVLLGADNFATIMEEVLRIAASQEANGTQVTSSLDTSQMPPPDMGQQSQPGASMDPMSVIRRGAAQAPASDRGMMGRRLPKGRTRLGN